MQAEVVGKVLSAGKPQVTGAFNGQLQWRSLRLIAKNDAKTVVRPRSARHSRVGVAKPADFAGAFEAIIRERLDTLHVLPVPVVFASRTKIFWSSLSSGICRLLPQLVSMFGKFLMSYGYDNLATWARAGSYVDRCLWGANPAELPVEQIDRFQLVINQKIARAIGFDTTSFLSRADEVIE